MRNQGWEQALYDYLEASKNTPFIWGQTDCAIWASTFVDQITGTNHAAQWAGLYDTEEGATALMIARGYANPEAIADAALTSRPVKTAQRGDLMLHPCGALGLCAGRLSYFLTPTHGLTPLPTTHCTKAWAV
jgi:hypothetical protein